MNDPRFAIGVVRFFQDNDGLKAVWGIGLPEQIKVALDNIRSKVRVKAGFTLALINLKTGWALPSIKPDQIAEALDDLRTQRRRFLSEEAVQDVQNSLSFYRQRYGDFGKPVVTVLRFVRKTRTIAGREIDQPVSHLGYGLGNGYGASVYGKGGVVDGYQAVYIFFTNEHQSQAVCLPLVDDQKLDQIIEDLQYQLQQALALEKSQDREVTKIVKATLRQMGA